MPIDIEEFESGTTRERTTAECIIEFLLENRDAAFTRGEIATAIDRDTNTVGTNLSRLKERGLVRHRKQHWALTRDLDRVADAIQFSNALSELEIDHGPLLTSESDAEAWADAQPDRSHPSSDTNDDTSGETAANDIQQ